MSPWDRFSHHQGASLNLGGLFTGRAPRAGRGVGVVHMYMSRRMYMHEHHGSRIYVYV